MVKFLYDHSVFMYVYAGLFGLGLLVRFIVNLVYKHLVKESDNPGSTKNKMIKHMKMKFETCYKLKIGVNNVDTFVDKYVLKYRFCGILLSTWDNFGGQILFMNLLMVPVCAVFGVVFACGQDKIILNGAVGILSGALLILVDKSINLSAKRKMIQLNLLDYMENFCKVRLEQEAYHPELLEQARREYAQVSEAKKQVGASKEEGKEELNRRKEARRKKLEEKRLQALKREEEHRRLEEARREEEQRKLEERKRIAAKRREEELRKLEEERQALEARRAELQRKALERQSQKKKLEEEKELERQKLLHSMEQELKPAENRMDMNKVLEGLDEIAADREQLQLASPEQEISLHVPEKSENTVGAKKQKAEGRGKYEERNIVEDKLIEDVLKEFFA
jgi:hypothetical protein